MISPAPIPALQKPTTRQQGDGDVPLLPHLELRRRLRASGELISIGDYSGACCVLSAPVTGPMTSIPGMGRN